MCSYKSGIILKTGRVIIELDTDSHSEIIEKHKLREGVSESMPWANFVSVECLPKKDLFSRDRSDWNFKLDEPTDVPTWFKEDEDHFKDLWFDEMFKVLSEKEKILNETGKWNGDLILYSGATLEALESVGGDLTLNSGATLEALESVGGDLTLYSGATLDAKKLESVAGGLYLYSGATLDAKKLESVAGDLYLNSGATLDALESVAADLILYSGATLDAKKLESVGGDLILYSGATLDAKKLESVAGDLHLNSGATMDALE